MALFTDMGLESTPVQALINRLYIVLVAMVTEVPPKHNKKVESRFIPQREQENKNTLNSDWSQLKIQPNC